MAREFIHARRVQFHETDAAGVLHFAKWFHLMEEAEHAFWREIGLSVHLTEGDNGRRVSWPRVATRCEYFAPARFEEVLRIAVRPEAVGNKSIRFAFVFERDGLKLAAGEIKAVCCAMDSGKFEPVPIPAAIRARLTAWMESG